MTHKVLLTLTVSTLEHLYIRDAWVLAYHYSNVWLFLYLHVRVVHYGFVRFR